MAELNPTKLGNKFECFNCGTRFYDLGKSEAICPKCGANQKDSNRGDGATAAASTRRKRKAEPVKPPVEVEDDVPAEEMPDDAIGEEIEGDLGGDDDEEEEDLDDEE